MRKLTIEILAEQPLADWIWESHMQGTSHDGVTIVGISEGHASITAVEADAPTPCRCEECGCIITSALCYDCGGE
jgi:hypothetical protein